MSSSNHHNHNHNHGLKVVRSGDNIIHSDHHHNNAPRRHSMPVEPFPDVVPVLELPAPPDGGWGWVIVFAGFMCNFILDGISYSFGVLLMPLAEYFNTSVGTVSWVGSLLSGIYQGSGPLVGGLVNKYGCRPVCIAGGIISCIALILSTFATSVPLLMMTYGALGGFGLGMVYLPAVVACGYYFEKRRALATGISVCGSGVGCFAFAPFAAVLLDEYGWRGTCLIFAGLALNCCIFGGLMRPLELVVQPIDTDEPRALAQGAREKRSNSTQVVEQEMAKLSFEEHMPTLEQQQAGGGGAVKRGSISNGPGALGLPKIPSLLSTTPYQSLTLLNEEIIEEPDSDGGDHIFEEGEPPTLIADRNAQLQTRRQTIASMRHAHQQHMRRHGSHGRLTKIIGLDGPPEVNKEHIIFGVNEGDHMMLQPSRRGSLMATVRPLARKDVFYAGSVAHLAGELFLSDPHLAPPPNLYERYRHSVISNPRRPSGHDHHHNPLPRGSIVASHLSIRREVIDPDLLSLSPRVSSSIKAVLHEMFDFHLLSNPLLLMMCMANVLGFLALYVPYVYLPNMMTMQENIDLRDASLVISAIGISNTVGRVFIGWVVDFPAINSLLVTNLSLLLSGLCMIFFPFCVTFESFLCLALLLGLAMSAYISLTSVVLVDLLGLDLLTSAFGMLVSFRGISSIVGPPLAGMVYEMTGRYDASFFMAGGFFIGASVIGQLAFHMHNRWKARQKNLSDSSSTSSGICGC